MRLNNILLSFFAHKHKFGADIQSMRLRYQALANIYINFSTAFAAIMYDLATAFILKTPCTFLVSRSIIPIIILSLWFLRQGMIKASCIAGCVHINISSVIACGYGKEPTIGFYALMADLVITFFFAYSKRVLVITLAIYVVLFAHYARGIQQIFAETLNEEQANQITNIIIAGAVALFLCFAALFVQKTVEIHLWDTAHINYQKSQILTKEALKASEAKDVFVSSLSHEIRNPLNSLKGSIDYLHTIIKCPEQLKILGNAKIGCDILINLVTNVLDAAKLRADKIELARSESCFRSVIKKALVINSETLRVKDIKVKTCIDRRTPKMLWIDHSRMLQIVMNLLSNALKFTPSGGKINIDVAWHSVDASKEDLLKEKKVLYDENSEVSNQIQPRTSYRQNSTSEFSLEELTTRQKSLQIKFVRNQTLEDINSIIHHPSDLEPWTIHEVASHHSHSASQDTADKGYLKVQFSDTGCGIAADRIPSLFQMFVQAHKSVSTMYGGTGLGLWICKQLCQRMDGDIKLYSKQRRGTTFVLYIPVDNSQAQSPVVARGASQGDTAPNVLIVDDYAHNRELHRLLVEKEGAQVVLACDGDEAVEKYKAHPEGYFSFIMMDILMTRVNGFQAAKLIREWETSMCRERKVDIYFVSGEYYNEYDIIAAFSASGGRRNTEGIRCLKKPIDIEEIKQTVEKYK